MAAGSTKDILTEIDEKYPRALAKARKDDARVKHIVGKRGGSSRAEYICNVCGATVDKESAKYPMTKHAREKVDAHAATHE